MAKEIIFEKLEKAEKILLLKAFDFSVDPEEYILTPGGNRISSEEIPSQFVKVDDAAFVPGSLKVIEGTPTSISKFIIEREGASDDSGN